MCGGNDAPGPDVHHRYSWLDFHVYAPVCHALLQQSVTLQGELCWGDHIACYDLSWDSISCVGVGEGFQKQLLVLFFTLFF